MSKLWRFIRQENNRQLLGWLGGGVVILAGGLWAAITFFYSPHPALQTPDVNVEAPGGVAAGRDISGSEITVQPPAPPAAGRSSVVTASRIFAGPHQYPPMEFAAYGILAFRSRPSPYDRGRHLMFCNAYVATLPQASELEVPRSKQMATVWPLNSDDHSDRLNQRADHEKNICQTAVDDYGLVIALQALKDAELTGKNLTRAGPFLLAWSPATDKGKHDALVLVSDLSDITTYEQAHERFLAWSRDIERDPTLWINGWNLERLRSEIRDWVDKYGAKSLAVFGVKG